VDAGNGFWSNNWADVSERRERVTDNELSGSLCDAVDEFVNDCSVRNEP
jgi:endo-alpha-1,4-polygalactosaminidase (GH114 family)